MPKIRARRGVAYGPGVTGKGQFRVREAHVAETYVPLLRAKKLGAVKLDLVLRGVALLPQHAGNREPGLVLPDISYRSLHDICRPPSRFSPRPPEDEIDDRKILRLKRNWVGKQLGILKQAGSVRREAAHRGRPKLIVQRDLRYRPLRRSRRYRRQLLHHHIRAGHLPMAETLGNAGGVRLPSRDGRRPLRPNQEPRPLPPGWCHLVRDPGLVRRPPRLPAPRPRTYRLRTPHPPTRAREPTHRQPRYLGTPNHTPRQARPPIPVRPTQHLHQPLRPGRRSSDSAAGPAAEGCHAHNLTPGVAEATRPGFSPTRIPNAQDDDNPLHHRRATRTPDLRRNVSLPSVRRNPTLTLLSLSTHGTRKSPGAFAELLHHVEVLTRNAMHNQLTALHAQAPQTAGLQSLVRRTRLGEASLVRHPRQESNRQGHPEEPDTDQTTPGPGKS